MPGGLAQLVISSGAQNNFLTGNPQISFFKSVYRKYTRFAMEHIRESAETSKLSKTNNIVTSIKVPRNGDLISGIFLEFTLPSIYSGKYGDTVHNYNFKWARNIASTLIKEVGINIGGARIDTITGEWLDIYYELTSNLDEKLLGRKLAGNIPELYDPENGAGQNGVYPHVTSGNQDTKYDSSGFNIEKISNISTTHIPTIPGNTYRIPIPFWFSGKSGSALPLIALQYHQVELQVTLAPLYDLYTALEVDSSNAAFGKRVKPTTGNEARMGIEQFVIDPNIVNVGSPRTFKNFDVNLEFNATYVFLDDEERKRFSVYEHEYLITQHHQVIKETTTQSTFSMKINGNNPVKYMVIVPKRAESKNWNDHFNYTNWLYPDISPSSFEYSNLEKFYDVDNSRAPFFTHGSSTSSDFTVANLNNNIIDKATLKFNGNSRFAKSSYQFFEFQQPLQHFKRDKKRGIYVYSFSIDPLNDQPTGACNFSALNETFLNFELNLISSSQYEIAVDLNVYLVNYNILKFVSGTAGLVYAT